MPWDAFELAERGWLTIPFDADFVLEADAAVAVLHLLPGHLATGIPTYTFGGDPAMFLVASTREFAERIPFSTPPGFLFDFVTIVAPVGADVQLDGVDVSARCGTRTIDEAWVVHECQLSFPESVSGTEASPGRQGDGFHLVVSDRPVWAIPSGFDYAVAYAFESGRRLSLSP